MTRTVLCYGDSNTHGTPAVLDPNETRRFAPEDRWPDVMAGRLGPNWTVIAEGHPGRTTVHDDPIMGAHRNGLRMLPATLETHWPLDAVILMLGTNDLKARFAVSAREIAQSIDVLVRTIRQYSDAKILAVAPAHVTETGRAADTFRGGAEKSRQLADRMRELLDVSVFDAAEVVSVDPTDGVHLTPQGQRDLGIEVAKELTRLMPI